MMGASHAATGALVGLLGTALVARFTELDPTGWTLVTGALIGAGAALLPDLDTHGSTATRSQGPVTALASTGIQALSARVYRATRTPADARSEGTHRYLFHTPACAVLVGLVVGVAATVWTAALVVTLWFTLSLALLGLGQCFSGAPRRAAMAWVTMTATGRALLRLVPAGARGSVARWVSVSFTAGVITALLVASGAAPSGPYVGAALALGMVTHVLGDAMTRSAVPLAWPVAVAGQRWRMLGMPRGLRFATGSGMEFVIRYVCMAATPGLALAIA